MWMEAVCEVGDCQFSYYKQGIIQRIYQKVLESWAPEIGTRASSSVALSSFVVYVLNCWFCPCEICLLEFSIFLHFHTYTNPKFCQFQETLIIMEVLCIVISRFDFLTVSCYANAELSHVLCLLEETEQCNNFGMFGPFPLTQNKGIRCGSFFSKTLVPNIFHTNKYLAGWVSCLTTCFHIS